MNGKQDENTLMDAEIAAYIRASEHQYQPSPEALALGASVGMSPAQVRRAIAMEAFLSLIRDPRRPHG
ncbi:hypothetical protein [Streptosporangium sp. KLBMP 9127]|nr:hypothetical protein [Streptosporangium sp. KLBMP 9127]